MHGTLPAPELNATARRPAFLRQRNWQVWLEMYREETPADSRGAWVRSAANAKDKNRVALVRDISLGGIQFCTTHRFESGALVHVEIWDPESENYRSFLVRVLRVTAGPSAREFLHSCAFLSMPVAGDQTLMGRSA